MKIVLSMARDDVYIVSIKKIHKTKMRIKY